MYTSFILDTSCSAGYFTIVVRENWRHTKLHSGTIDCLKNTNTRRLQNFQQGCCHQGIKIEFSNCILGCNVARAAILSFQMLRDFTDCRPLFIMSPVESTFTGDSVTIMSCWMSCLNIASLNTLLLPLLWYLVVVQRWLTRVLYLLQQLRNL